MLFITFYPVTPCHTYIYFSTFLYESVLIFGGHQEAHDGIGSFEIYLYPMFIAVILKIFTKTSSVRHYHVNVVAFVIVSCDVAISVFGAVVIFVVVFV